MCVSPVKIKNPNFGLKNSTANSLVDTKSRFIYVPCNVCSECVMSRQSQVVQRARVLALDHYIFYCTLTYNNRFLPRLTLSNGFSIPFADISDVQRMFKRIRYYNKIDRDFLYYFVSERGSEKGRPHFHGLIFLKKFKDDDKLYPAITERYLWKMILLEWKRNLGSDRCPDWHPLLNYRQKFVHGVLYRNYDLHYVVPHSTEKGSDDVAFYVTKYLLKPSDKERRLQQALSLNLDPEEFESVWSVIKSRSFCSKGFGASTDLEKNFVRSCIEKSQFDKDGLKIYHSDGSSSPLARYYKKFVSLENGINSVSSRGGPYSVDDRTQSEKDISLMRGSIIKQKASKRDISELFPLD